MATNRCKRKVSFENVPNSGESPYVYESGDDEDVLSLSDSDSLNSAESSDEWSENQFIDTYSGSEIGSNISLMDTNEINYYSSRDGSKWTKNVPQNVYREELLISPAEIPENSSHFTSPSDAFKLFFSDEVITQILKFTNAKLNSHLATEASKNSKIKEIIFSELKAFIGLMILVGVFRVHREPLANLYSNDPNFSRPIFKATLTRERFKTILRFLRFDDEGTRLIRISSDRLAPIREVFESINSAFRKSYSPHKYLTIDEHMCAYRGRRSFRQYLPSKPDRYGIKMYILADSINYYPINIIIYSGKTRFSNKPEDIVLRLVSHLNPGHVIVGDNYFTSLSLCKRLWSDYRIRYFGTLRKNRKEIPPKMLEIKKIPVYSSKFIYCEDNTMLSYITHKNTNVLLLSNYHHDAKIVEGVKQKPQIIMDYNKYKCGVDILDMLLKGHRPYRTIRRWPCVVFFDLIAMSSQASYVLFCSKYPETVIAKKKKRRDFLYQLGRELVLPEIRRRKELDTFRCLNKDVKNYMDFLLESDLHDNIDTSLSSNLQIPLSEFVEIPPTPLIIQTQDEHIEISQIEPEFLTPRVHIEISPSEQTVISVSQPIDVLIDNSKEAESSTVLNRTPTQNEKPPTQKGRCSLCIRSKDIKIRSTCKICSNYVCTAHSKNSTLCFTCLDKVN